MADRAASRRLIDPPVDRLPQHIAEALAAQERVDRGDGPPLTTAQAAALLELTSWSFVGVPREHPEFDARLRDWTAKALARHRRATLG